MLSKMYYVYILESFVDGSYYIGQTSNIADRIQRHNSGRGGWTRRKMPWFLKYGKTFLSRSEAVGEELKLKSFKRRKLIEDYVLREGYSINIDDKGVKLR